jgi:hypothetical protein
VIAHAPNPRLQRTRSASPPSLLSHQPLGRTREVQDLARRAGSGLTVIRFRQVDRNGKSLGRQSRAAIAGP